MDPKSQNISNPQLKEEYERIMNTPTKPGQEGTITQSYEIQQPSSPQAIPSSETPGAIAESSEIPIQQTQIPDNPSEQEETYQENTTEEMPQTETTENPWEESGIPSNQADSDEQSNGEQTNPANLPTSRIRMVYIIGSIVFMLMYAIFWFKILGFF